MRERVYLTNVSLSFSVTNKHQTTAIIVTTKRISRNPFCKQVF